MTITAHHVSIDPTSFISTITVLTDTGYIWQGSGQIAEAINKDELELLEFQLQANNTLKTLIDIPQFLLGCVNLTPEATLESFMLTNSMVNYLTANGIDVTPVYAPTGQYGEAYTSRLPGDLDFINDLQGKHVYLYKVFSVKYVEPKLGYPMIGYAMRAKVV